MTNWLDLDRINAMRDRFDADVAEVLEDRDLTRAAKARRVREMADGFRDAFAAEKRQMEAAVEQRRDTLTKKAYPSEELGTDVQKELVEEMRAGRIEREIAAQAEGGAFNPVAALKDARDRGDTARQAVIERVGRRYLPEGDEGMRRTFSEAVQESRRGRMTPAQRSAFDELEAFEHQAGEVGQALSMADRTVRTKLDGLSRMPVPEDVGGRGEAR